VATRAAALALSSVVAVALVLGLAAEAGARPVGGPAPVRAVRVGGVARPLGAGPEILYLNFSEGKETFTFAGADGADDATRNVSVIGPAAPYPPFSWPELTAGTSTRRELVRRIARRVHELFLPYDVVVTTTRPAAGPYTMVVIGGSPALVGFSGVVAGLAFMDCANLQQNNVVYAFPDVLKGSFHGLTVTIAQEAAHAFGLEHTGNVADIMYPNVRDTQVGFPDVDSPIVGEPLCGNRVQNSHRRLLELVGAWRGDEKPVDDGSRDDRTPPALSILEPAAGATVPPTFVVRVSAEEETELDFVAVAAGGEQATLRERPFAWSFSRFAPGPLEVVVTAYDAAGNLSTARVNVTVAAGGGEAPGGCAVGRGARTTPGGLGLALLLGGSALATCTRRRRGL
jgi:hypothetical protein